MKHYLTNFLRVVLRKILGLELEQKLSSRIGDKVYEIPIITGIGYGNNANFEPWMGTLLQLMGQLNPVHFMDVGVNLGQTLLKVRNALGDIPYLGFEPNPSCVNYTYELIKRNNIKNVRIIPAGISDQSGVIELNFYADSDTDSSASIIQNFRSNKVKSSFVVVVQPDMITQLSDLPRGVHFLKIDVEGAELEVINGLTKYVKDNKPVIFMEILPVYSDDNLFRIERQDTLLNLLKSHDYSILRIIKDQTDNEFSHLEPKEDIEIHGDIALCDYIFSPKEMTGSIESMANQSSHLQ
ncbi:MAG: FkbM family methyltransferase [Psychroserpens sp.]|uniref:FkbM family methyltransferase n=1 Tax=Psychroserpens sp. TaxID=2020870 RepID=UPI003CBFE157